MRARDVSAVAGGGLVQKPGLPSGRSGRLKTANLCVWTLVPLDGLSGNLSGFRLKNANLCVWTPVPLVGLSVNDIVR